MIRGRHSSKANQRVAFQGKLAVYAWDMSRTCLGFRLVWALITIDNMKNLNATIKSKARRNYKR